MEKTIKFEIECSETHYSHLLKALDLYSRLLMGQTTIIQETLNYNGIQPKNKNSAEIIAKEIALNYFDGIDGISHLGISNTCKGGQSAYELYSTLRYEKGDEPQHSVYNQEPLNYTNKTLKVNFEQSPNELFFTHFEKILSQVESPKNLISFLKEKDNLNNLLEFFKTNEILSNYFVEEILDYLKDDLDGFLYELELRTNFRFLNCDTMNKMSLFETILDYLKFGNPLTLQEKINEI